MATFNKSEKNLSRRPGQALYLQEKRMGTKISCRLLPRKRRASYRANANAEGGHENLSLNRLERVHIP